MIFYNIFNKLAIVFINFVKIVFKYLEYLKTNI